MMNNMTPTVKQLLIINIIFFLGTQVLGNIVYEYFALFSFESPNFRFWQLVTHMFMHGGVMHIAFNMFALVSFGTMLESIWGSKKFLFFYISCGLGAGILQNLINSYTHDILSVAVGALVVVVVVLLLLLLFGGDDGGGGGGGVDVVAVWW